MRVRKKAEERKERGEKEERREKRGRRKTEKEEGKREKGEERRSKGEGRRETGILLAWAVAVVMGFAHFCVGIHNFCKNLRVLLTYSHLLQNKVRANANPLEK